MDLLESYRANGPGHDEMLQATGSARAAWTELAVHAHLGQAEELLARQADVVALLQDQGVPYGESGDGWQLDPLPVLVEEAEWHRLEGALRQRSELLDQVLADLYGDRRLLTSGLLPPEIVLGHPGFLRGADHVGTPGRRQLLHASADLVRNADGAWTVLADTTDVPAGLGYAMADRRVVSEILAGLYRQSRTRRVGPFFQALALALREAAPSAAGDAPHAAVLAPGPSDPSAFDHAYLSAMLGLPLVQGSDLVVADGHVWSRSLGGRERVDVLLRGVPAASTDPLELDRTSRVGTPGLLHAARTGAVTIVNTLGAGVLENPALLTYLPRLSRALRDEELALPSALTYWCGDRAMCSHVIANLGRLVVRSTSGHEPPVLGWLLSLGERADLAARISAHPSAWVGQEPVEASTTPTVSDGSLVPRRTSLRTFAVAAGEGYAVMSGGVGRVGPDPQAAAGVPGLSGTAKDVWVLASEPETAPVLLQPLRPGVATISPRAAADLFRLGRLTERAESTVRLLLAVADRWDDYHARPGAPAGSPGEAALAVLLGALHETTADAPLPMLVSDAALDGSVAWCVARMGRSAAAVRDNLTPDVWLALSSLERTLRRERARRRDEESGLGTVLGRLLEGLLALHGIYAESLVRDAGWHLLEVGRRLERAQRLVATLEATVTERREAAVAELVSESVLIANESIITFRRRHPGGGVGELVQLLLLDRSNPRALAYQLDSLAGHLAALPALVTGAAGRDQLLQEVLDLLDELDPARVDGHQDAVARRVQLAQTLESMRWRLGELTTEITRVHLAQPVPVRWSEEGWER